MKAKREHSADERPDVLKAAVIGAGNMGLNHMRVYSALKDVELVGMYDDEPSVANAAAVQFGLRAFRSLEEVADSVDAVSICTPSVTHGEVGAKFLERGVHCLIEKPLATTQADCEALIATAEASGAQLLVGHIERFNPAVRKTASILQNGQVWVLDTQRLNSFSKRITDVDVIADLMIHDLEIVLSLAGEYPVAVTAAGVRSSNGFGGDHVTALLQFQNGAMATCTASRISQGRKRRLTVTADFGFMDVDYMGQTVEIYYDQHQRGGPEVLSGRQSYDVDVAMERLQVRRSEPLQVELSHFVELARGGGEPIVSGRQALDAMRLVWEIQDQVRH